MSERSLGRDWIRTQGADGPIDGGPADAEQLSELRCAVGAGVAELEQVSSLVDGQPNASTEFNRLRGR
jgi:hypothetical protein